LRVAELVRAARAEGWSAAVRPGGHLELRHAGTDAVIITSATPSDHRWWRNTLARMRRALPPAPPPKRPAKPKVRRKRIKSEPARAWPEPLAMHRLPEPERRFYPPEPVCARLPGGPSGFRSCLDRV
jgi:hypothetical protein